MTATGTHWAGQCFLSLFHLIIDLKTSGVTAHPRIPGFNPGQAFLTRCDCGCLSWVRTVFWSLCIGTVHFSGWGLWLRHRWGRFLGIKHSKPNRSFPSVSLTYSSPFKSLLKCHFLREAFHDHSASEGSFPLPFFPWHPSSHFTYSTFCMVLLLSGMVICRC